MSKIIIKGIVLLTITLGYFNSMAQQDPMYTHYMFNTLSINPAYAGSREALNVSGLLRAQWVGIKGAPMTQTAYIHSPIFNYSMGLGLSVVNDKIGPINQTVIYGDYSYTVKLTETQKLSFGLKGGFNYMTGSLTSLETIQSNDQAFNQDVSSRLLPNFGFGVYYHSDYWYLGASTPKLIENKIVQNTDLKASKEQRHYFIIGGAVINLGDAFKFKPSTCIKMTQGAPLAWDVSGMIMFREKLWLGGAYRWDDSFSFILQIQATDQLSIGYSYDINTSNLRKYNYGSHEIYISYDFVFKRDRIMSPRYF